MMPPTQWGSEARAHSPCVASESQWTQSTLGAVPAQPYPGSAMLTFCLWVGCCPHHPGKQRACPSLVLTSAGLLGPGLQEEPHFWGVASHSYPTPPGQDGPGAAGQGSRGRGRHSLTVEGFSSTCTFKHFFPCPETCTSVLLKHWRSWSPAWTLGPFSGPGLSVPSSLRASGPRAWASPPRLQAQKPASPGAGTGVL